MNIKEAKKSDTELIMKLTELNLKAAEYKWNVTEQRRIVTVPILNVAEHNVNPTELNSNKTEYRINKKLAMTLVLKQSETSLATARLHRGGKVTMPYTLMK
ncbi:hypothetical protein HX109_05980 [Galbibacter sp. BG1]|uniref:hypothetical protein n=1 Tax=Galbibacter sp. BG1 TaxID=1170699 RepID=UPI0015C18A1D|nr:hypothetical protein [Galbibacter sp. BG1]QLE01133.1 hypothetical protein HX109_05980 [Galbibacter sp. BG1]